MKVRSVFKLGDSIAITIPKNMGIARGDQVVVSQDKNGRIIITKIDIPEDITEGGAS